MTSNPADNGCAPREITRYARRPRGCGKRCPRDTHSVHFLEVRDDPVSRRVSVGLSLWIICYSATLDGRSRALWHNTVRGSEVLGQPPVWKSSVIVLVVAFARQRVCTCELGPVCRLSFARKRTDCRVGAVDPVVLRVLCDLVFGKSEHELCKSR